MTAAAARTAARSLQRHVPALAMAWLSECPEQRWRRLEGTLCFADISGFTALAERLARRGRAGGEELVETLGRVFTGMLDIVHDQGGELLKFGGDPTEVGNSAARRSARRISTAALAARSA